MTEIKINNSRLKLVKLDVRFNKVTIDKSKLKYQCLYFVGSKYGCEQMFGVSTTILPTDIGDVWVIEKCDLVKEKQEYDRYEISVLASVLRNITFAEHLDVAEIICHAIGDGKLLNLFYSSFGKMESFFDRIEEIIQGGSKLTIIDRNYAPQYQRSRYSVYELLYDLKKDGAEIYVGPDLVSYRRMSSSGDREYKGLFSWSRVTSVLGNRDRANLSLVSYSYVDVYVPENEFGVESGNKQLKEFKTSCIIKDGILWTREIGVRISRKLYKRLVHTGVIKAALFEDEYLLDLSKIPVISKKFLKVSGDYLSDCEVKSRLFGYAITYKATLDKMAKLGLKKAPVKSTPVSRVNSDYMKFLNDLGIHGDVYYKPITKPKKLTKESVHCITSTVNDYLPETSFSQIKKFIDLKFWNCFLNFTNFLNLAEGISSHAFFNVLA